MNTRMRSKWLMMGIVVGSAVLAAEATAQAAVSVAVGVASYDLSGTGTSGVAAARIEMPVWRAVQLQVGSGFFWYRAQDNDNVSVLLPEAGALLRIPGAVPLYLGAGVGHTLAVNGDTDDDPMLYGAVGLEIVDRAGWAIRPELRLRSVDPWAGSIADFTIGVRRRLGS